MRVIAFEKACEFMEVDARAREGEIRVTTSNVGSLTLDIHASPVRAEEVGVSLDGVRLAGRPPLAHYLKEAGRWRIRPMPQRSSPWRIS